MPELDTIDFENVVKAIRQVCEPSLIILFGSRAQGRTDENSDLDLLIVEDEPFSSDRPRLQELGRIRDALEHVEIPKDVLVYSRDEFARYRLSPSHVVSSAIKSGRILYERS
jgi:predicted nucleotidyltransferase